MSESSVRWVMRADAVFNMFAGIMLQFYLSGLLKLLGWPTAETRVYALVLGSALIGLSLMVWAGSRRPPRAREILIISIITHLLAGLSILYEVFIVGIDLPSPWLLPAAVGVQVLFVLGQAYYLLTAHPANAYSD
ncbi:MAG: hypothetical protein M9896_08560 [Candidatus Promineofilum sp.]|uniref:hypothetical protein n=1 Tax=Promineifilum sp. TaxID=2664178 RepID=UPI002411C708|nr:hypothetical protein [Promineifilum sp.]